VSGPSAPTSFNPVRSPTLSPSRAPPASACGLVHFRKIIRPHTDPALGHCSYLNTCYSEPTYALSPSVPPPGPAGGAHARPNSSLGVGGAPNANSPVSLPSGLGAGGRGKEKAPCRYLHFEVDYDETSPGANAPPARPESRKKKLGLPIGLGPTGKISEPVSFTFVVLEEQWSLNRTRPAPTAVDQL
jgi:mRNA (2'-O-methyladenosine-N6-)-methyltransferase